MAGNNMMDFSRLFFAFLCVCIFSFNSVRSLPVEDTPSAESSTLVLRKSVADFAKGLLQKLSSEKPCENVLISPISAYAALLMVHLGAGEKTRSSLDEALKLSGKYTDLTKLHEAFGDIVKKVHQKTSDIEKNVVAEAMMVNRLFMQKGHPILDSYTQSLTKFYNSSVMTLDFAEHAKDATDAINSWIYEATRNRINDFFKSPLDSDTVAMLTSALYFSGKWKNTFSKHKTSPGKFNTGSAEIEVPMMQNTQRVSYRSSDSFLFDAVELDYFGGEFALFVVLPRPAQTLKNLTEHMHLITGEELRRIEKMANVDYKIPKMKLSWRNSLVNALHLRNVFDSADLSAMTTDPKVYIKDLDQGTEMEIDEEGTIASAVTAVAFGSRSGFNLDPDSIIKFYVDRPYLVTLIHKPTQTMLFLGAVYNPKM